MLFLFICPVVFSQGQYKNTVRPTKNVIVMIPDGTSMGVVSAARWYKTYNNMGEGLYIDPFLCGTVKTFSSNAPIGDSAPTTSCYMTGIPQQAGNVSIYPVADPDNDLIPVDPEMTYQPLATILEAARITQDKATGLVVTCEFPHATPADCAAHYYARNNYKAIAPQMAFQNLDVMFGGGNDYISETIKKHFENKQVTYIKDDVEAFRSIEEGKVWALFGGKEFPYDLDRDETLPSLEEMTRKALDVLSLNENGFFLMVEGSLIDWAAHANDAVGCITEFIAFDNAVGTAMEFAKKDGNTTVIVLPDHGNSGFTIGRRGHGYSRATIHSLFKNVSNYKKTAYGLEKIILESQPEDIKGIVKEYTGIEISDEEYENVLGSKNYLPEDYMKAGDSKNLVSVLVEIMNERTSFGFTTGGHTGEDVFLAAYHPQGDIPIGMNTNVEINQYLSDAAGLEKPLSELTAEIFAKHTEVFGGMKYSIKTSKDGSVGLEVKKGRKKLVIPAFSSVAYLNGKPFDMESVAVYIDKNETFYLPKSLLEKL
nr:alkaline phosphatase [Paludibacter sp. 221]